MGDFARWAATSGARVLTGDFDGDRSTDVALVRQEVGWNTMPVAYTQEDGTFRIANRLVGDFARWATMPGARLVVGNFRGLNPAPAIAVYVVGADEDGGGTGESGGGETEGMCREGTSCTVEPWQCGARPGFEVTGRIVCDGETERCEALPIFDFCSTAGGRCGRAEGNECDATHLCAPGMLCVGVGGLGETGRCHVSHCEIPTNFCWTQDEVGDPLLVCQFSRNP